MKDRRAEEKAELMGDLYIPDKPITVEDGLRADSHLASRIGPDPFPLESEREVFDSNVPSTWYTETWAKDKQWKKAFVGTHLFLNLMDLGNKRIPRGRIIFTQGPPHATVSSGSDDFTDDEPHYHAKRRPSGEINQEILEEVRGIRQDITTLSQQTKLTPQLRQHLADSFKCQICKDVPMKPPIISMGCCKRLLGCKACIEEAYIQHPIDQSCPFAAEHWRPVYSGGWTSS